MPKQINYMTIEQLHKFLLEAQLAGYASGQETKFIKEPDGSTSIIYKKGLFTFHDNYFGGEPYGGRSVIFYNNKPVWIMIYYGSVSKDISPNLVYKVLRNALKLTPSKAPFRGPKEYREDNFIYINNWDGDIKNFSGKEQISKNKLIT
jgi:hypothetical protein